MRVSTLSVTSRLAVGAAIAAAAALAAPALASAATLAPPTMTTSVDANVVSVTITNPNTDATSGCSAAAVDAAKVPELLKDPTKFLEPGAVAWTSGASITPAGESRTYTTAPLADGTYAFLGACLSPTAPTPVLGDPELVTFGSPFGSLGDLDLGELLGSLDLGELLG
ncbi:hypothetical protein [Prescottella subtropica]|uniref:hypothetical protein n=1 Tax=Prescottella subtropica TaxID=2545757 RepID=UPI0010F4E7C9|nr:hypothetical protein [Prescottella subtropica]